MATPNPYNSNDEELVENDLTTTAQVLSAREILDRLENDAAEQHEASLRSRGSWWRRVLGWIGLR